MMAEVQYYDESNSIIPKLPDWSTMLTIICVLAIIVSIIFIYLKGGV